MPLPSARCLSCVCGLDRRPQKNTGPATREIDEFVLLLGVADVAASKRFYVERGLEVAKSFARVYVEFAASPGQVKLGPYKRRARTSSPRSPSGQASHEALSAPA